MDPLQYFDEEYSSLHSSINQISGMMLQCSDSLSQIMTIQKRLQTIYKNGNLKSQELQDILGAVSAIADLSKDILEASQVIKSSILFNSES